MINLGPDIQFNDILSQGILGESSGFWLKFIALVILPGHYLGPVVRSQETISFKLALRTPKDKPF